jgi:hypothetical protein
MAIINDERKKFIAFFRKLNRKNGFYLNLEYMGSGKRFISIRFLCDVGKKIWGRFSSV